MAAAHAQGIDSTATMMMGTGETAAERIEHLRMIRDVQDLAVRGHLDRLGGLGCAGDVLAAHLALVARHGHHVSAGTLYPLLHRMEDDGLLVSRQQVVEGRVLRLYAATARGREELAACRHALRELADEVLP